jgi:hypothetical protein
MSEIDYALMGASFADLEDPRQAMNQRGSVANNLCNYPAHLTFTEIIYNTTPFNVLAIYPLFRGKFSFSVSPAR